ncbi:MAG: DNA-processing protein DprA [Candidatus Hydrogenedentes bacterium]|nr:DNA-processing protein DprA [Candidatus Hydrogenedentota bacterium]
MNTRDVATLLALCHVSGVGNATARRALHAAQHLGVSVFYLTRLEPQRLLERLPVGDFDTLVSALQRTSETVIDKVESEVQRFLSAGGRVFLATDDDYPAKLTLCLGNDAPAFLFCFGDIAQLDAPSAAVVGARKVSAEGALLAAKCARTFAEAGVTVVSGGAEGVDTIAHNESAQAGGKTVMVLPMGMLNYPAPAVADMLERGVLTLVSQFPLSAVWQTVHAVTRNATISAFADVVCVIEPRKAGGSARAGRCGLEQGKIVLVHPGADDGGMGETLFREGALPLAQDGDVDAMRLLRFMSEPPQTRPKQTELF